jgi:hypothetical protein
MAGEYAVDHRKDKHPFGGILLQELSIKEKKLVGPVRNIFKGTDIKLVEGPHIYKHNGYYYLLTAEGGTVLRHSVTMARSKNLEGPYEVDPQIPYLLPISIPNCICNEPDMPRWLKRSRANGTWFTFADVTFLLAEDAQWAGNGYSENALDGRRMAPFGMRR